MNVLILTGKFGMGHCSAAKAIKENLLKGNSDIHVDVVDFLSHMFPRLSRGVYATYGFAVQYLPFLYNFLNDTAGHFTDVPLKQAISAKIEQLFTEYHPDVVVSTLPLCSQYISAYKQTASSDIPLYTYITDIVAHEEWIAKHTDMYFTGDETTKNSLVSRGIPAEKITVSGIPLRPEFYSDEIKNASRLSDKKELLVMGGGLGLIPTKDCFLERLVKDSNVHITMITGSNEKLLKRIQERFPSIEAIGWTGDVYKYLQRADIIITKAGGVTLFEAIATCTPLYVIKPFLAQEVGNAEYIEQHNIGRVMWASNTKAAEDILALLSDENLLNAMNLNMLSLKNRWKNKQLLPIFSRKSEVSC